MVMESALERDTTPYVEVLVIDSEKNSEN